MVRPMRFAIQRSKVKRESEVSNKENPGYQGATDRAKRTTQSFPKVVIHFALLTGYSVLGEKMSFE